MDNYYTKVENVDRVHFELKFDDSVEQDKINEEENGKEELIGQEKFETKEEELEKKIVGTEDSETKSTGRNTEDAEVKRDEDKPLLSNFDMSKDVASSLTANAMLDRDTPGNFTSHL